MNALGAFLIGIVIFLLVPLAALMIPEWFSKRRQHKEVKQYLADFDYTEPHDALAAHATRFGGASETFVKVILCSPREVHDRLREAVSTSGREWFESRCQDALKIIGRIRELTDNAMRNGKQRIEVMRAHHRIHTTNRWGYKDREARLEEILGSEFGLVYHRLCGQGLAPAIEYVEWQGTGFATSWFRMMIPVQTVARAI